MAYLKVEESKMKEKIQRTTMNTTIEKELLGAFKAKCRTSGIPMNMILEIFMRQFINDEVVLKFANNRLTLGVDELNNSELKEFESKEEIK